MITENNWKYVVMKLYRPNDNILAVLNIKINIIHKFGIVIGFVKIYNLLMEAHTSFYCIM